MATVGNLALTLSDLRKRTGPQGEMDWVLEALNESNPILDDIPWLEGNLPTGNQTTVRTSVPMPSLRRINRGVDPSKSTTKQVADTCSIFEARSEVDIELLALAPDKAQFRRSEDVAHIEGFGQAVARNILYGDSMTNPDEFNGLGVRYNVLKGEKGEPGYQVVSAGGTGKTNTSIWIVGWGERTVTGIYPRNTYAGLKVRDLGENDAVDPDGRKFRAVSTLFTWKPGLAVRDQRAVAAVRNINVSNLLSLDSDGKRSLIEKFILAKNRLRNLDTVNAVAYVNDDVYSFLEIYLIDKNNVHVTRRDLADGQQVLYLAGIPVRKLDALRSDEEVIK